MKKFKLTLTALITGLTLAAQETPNYYINKYQNEFAVKLQEHCLTNIKIKKGELEIEQRYIEKTVYLDKMASSIGNISLKYNPPFTSLDDVSAYVLNPQQDKDDYNKVKIKDIKDEAVMSDDIFYGGERAKIFSFPGLQKGSVSVLEYTKTIHEPKLIGTEIFQGFRVVEDQLLELAFDEGVVVNIKYFNCNEDDFEYSIEHKGGQHIHRWKPKSYRKFKDEKDMPSYLRVLPHIIYRIESYNYKGKNIPVLRNTTDLHDWYKSLLGDVLADKSKEINHLTDSLIAGATTEQEKTERIFKWVQGNIKYIAFEDGLGGFKPRNPSQVFGKRYGDCKDMSCLTVQMLQYAGIPAYHTWIGTRTIPYTYSDVPSPITDNHMIVTAKVNEDLIFLDPTNSDLPYPLPSSFIQGKEAMIGVSMDSFLIKAVPVVASHQNLTYDSAYIKLEELDLKGKGNRKYLGYYADVINRGLNNNDKKRQDDLLKVHVRKGNNKCNSSGYSVDRQNRATSVDYEFTVPEYAYSDGEQVFINLNLEKIMDDFKIEKDREHPVEYRFTYKIIRKFSLEIPESYIVQYIPEEVNETYKDFGFKLSYQKNEKTLDYFLEIDINTLYITQEDFEHWNKMIKTLNRNYNETIILKKA